MNLDRLEAYPTGRGRRPRRLVRKHSTMTHKDRVARQIRGEEVDHVPLMGGWFHGVDNLAALAGVSVEGYLVDPVKSVLKANRALAVDCMIPPIVPAERDQVRTGHVLDADRTEFEPERLKEDAERLPDRDEEVVMSLDMAQIESDYRDSLTSWMQTMDDIVLIPTHWESVPNFMIYAHYGYEAYLMAIALYPEAVGRLYWRSAVEARARNVVLARLMCELDLPPVLFTGHDICNNAGPMCSLDFLRQYYFPQERLALEPLTEAGIRVVRHCDGNVMPILDDSLDVGYSGFQGFQYECGVDPFAIARKGDAKGEPLLFFAGLNVTRTLPFGTIEDVREEVEYVMDYTDGGKGLFFFTSSSIGPEVPLENVKYAYDYVANRECRQAGVRAEPREWPWEAEAR